MFIPSVKTDWVRRITLSVTSLNHFFCYHLSADFEPNFEEAYMPMLLNETNSLIFSTRIMSIKFNQNNSKSPLWELLNNYNPWLTPRTIRAQCFVVIHFKNHLIHFLHGICEISSIWDFSNEKWLSSEEQKVSYYNIIGGTPQAEIHGTQYTDASSWPQVYFVWPLASEWVFSLI